MGQPTILAVSGLAVAKFGNAPLPNGQGTLTNINLNDGVNTFLRTMATDEVNRQLELAQLLYRARSAYIADDYGPRVIKLPMIYQEDGSHFVGQLLAALAQAGEQQLTFDNATYILAKFRGASNRAALKPRLPLAWSFDLDLVAKSPWFVDAAATTGSVNVTAASGVATTFNITYAGSIFCEPVFTFTMPNANATYTQMVLTNTMSGESLTLVPPTYGAGSHTINVDSGNFAAYFDIAATTMDPVGSFPMLYGPAGQANAFSITMTYSGSISGTPTLAWSYMPRWMI